MRFTGHLFDYNNGLHCMNLAGCIRFKKNIELYEPSFVPNT